MKWCKDTKEKIQYGTAVMMLVTGAVLAVISLVMNDWAEIPDSVLWYTAQCFVYAGSVFGVSLVINYKFGQIESHIRRQLDENEKGSSGKTQ